MNIFTLFGRDQILFQTKRYKEPLMFLIMELGTSYCAS